LFLAYEGVDLELHLASVESVERLISNATSPRPLSMKLRLRPLIAIVCDICEEVRHGIGWPECHHVSLSWKPERAATRWLI
jgi:hypothetical protein